MSHRAKIVILYNIILILGELDIKIIVYEKINLGNANDTSLMAVGNQLVPIQETDISVKYEFYNPRDIARKLCNII